MLVLTRKAGEAVKVTVGGEVLWVTLLSERRGKVRLGFAGGPEVVIEREEVAALRAAVEAEGQR